MTSKRILGAIGFLLFASGGQLPVSHRGAGSGASLVAGPEADATFHG